MSIFLNNQTQQTAVSTGTLGVATGRALFTNTSNHLYIVTSVTVAITTTATVGNRTFYYNVVDGSGNLIYASPTTATVAAATTQKISGGPNIPTTNTTTLSTLTLNDPAILLPGYVLKVTDLASIDVNDNVASGQIVLQS